MCKKTFFNFKNWILYSGQTVRRTKSGISMAKKRIPKAFQAKKKFWKSVERFARKSAKTFFCNVKIFSFSKNPQKATLSEINENRVASSPGPNGSESTSSRKTPALTKFVSHLKVGSSDAIFAFFGLFWRFLRIFSAVYWRICLVKIFFWLKGLAKTLLWSPCAPKSYAPFGRYAKNKKVEKKNDHLLIVKSNFPKSVGGFEKNLKILASHKFV